MIAIAGETDRIDIDQTVREGLKKTLGGVMV